MDALPPMRDEAAPDVDLDALIVLSVSIDKGRCGRTAAAAHSRCLGAKRLTT